MTMSFTSLPDAAAIGEELLGRAVVSAEPIGQGRNSRVFRIALAPGGDLDSVVLKFYRQDPGDGRDRLGVEFNALTFLWHNNVRVVPRPVMSDRARNCAIYEFIDGRTVAGPDVSAGDIVASVDFLANLRRLSGAEGSRALPAASEACFSIADVMTSVRGRLARLQAAPAADEQARRLQAWLARDLVVALDDIAGWIRTSAARWGIDPASALPQAARTLSPSDFGFHNTVRRPDGTLAFVDFEYFGWDDPAKTVVDYLLHPGMALAEPLKQQFAREFLASFPDVRLLSERARLVYPLFGLKWCLIILNDFLPDRQGTAPADVRETQLAKAQQMVARLTGTYAANPYLA